MNHILQRGMLDRRVSSVGLVVAFAHWCLCDAA